MVSMQPKVSFIATVFNGQDYLADTLRSIFIQTLMPDIEVIYVNDGSTDATWRILEFYRKQYPEQMKIVNIGENRGCGYALNRATALVTSPIIVVASGDDLYVENRAELHYEALKGKTNGVHYGAYHRINAKGDVQQGILCDGTDASTCDTIPWKKGLLFEWKQYIPHPFMAVSTELAKRVPYRVDIKVGIDYPWLKGLETAGADFYSTPDILGFYRFHAKMVSSSRRKEVLEA
jgi:glycosyltransferase involved in cell wall biosynthesis